MAEPTTLEDWLSYIDRVHPQDMELGLARVQRVASSMQLLPLPHVSILVAGTNGKGSTCVALEHMLMACGVRAGTTLSPHVRRFNERLRVDGCDVEDAVICAAFAAIEQARGATTLTYFEFATLAALLVFSQANVDVGIYEIGLGGRLDAFNIIDADMAVVTSIGLDHQAMLGDTRDAIGAEKAGIFRAGQLVVLGADMPSSVWQAAGQLGCAVWAQGREYQFAHEPQLQQWSYGAPAAGWLAPLTLDVVARLPLTVHLTGRSTGVANANVGNAIAACQRLFANRVVTPPTAARSGPRDWLALATQDLDKARLPGRLQEASYGDKATIVIDVGHNAEAAAYVDNHLAKRFAGRPVIAVLGMLADKDPNAYCAALSSVSAWVLTDTRGWRAQKAIDLQQALQQPQTERVSTPNEELLASPLYVEPQMSAALQLAESLCQPDGVILVSGSFSVVQLALEQIESTSTANSTLPSTEGAS